MAHEPLQRTKIVCTLGPSTDDQHVLRRVVEAGVNVARINAAHGSPDEHARRIRVARATAKSLGCPLSILIDLPGPKFRLGRLPQGSLQLQKGQDILLAIGPVAEPQAIPVRFPQLERQVEVGEPVYLADGTVKLIVTRREPRRIRARVAIGGTIRSGSGINLPESDLSVKLPTPDDARWIAFARTHQVEWIGVSFVRTVEDLTRVRRAAGPGATAMLMAKIEKRQALNRLDEIISAADGVMVARGDLGVETPLAEVPIVQKRIIARANEHGKPVITATQMLESMVENSSPTRAEVTDVANAVLDGSDALMLSAETAIGRHPVEAVQTLRSVIAATEGHYPFGAVMERLSRTTWSSMADAMSFVACRLSFDIQAKAIVAPLEDAATAFRIARFRPQAPVLALSRSSTLVRQLNVVWDVYPLVVPPGAFRAIEAAKNWLLDKRLARRGDSIILVSTLTKDRGQVRDSLQVTQL